MIDLTDTLLTLDIAIRKLRETSPPGQNPDLDVVLWLLVIVAKELQEIPV